jgi:hypothetical protein
VRAIIELSALCDAVTVADVDPGRVERFEA